LKDYLTIFCLTNLGDGVILSPCISALSENLNDIKLVLVAKPSVCELYEHDKRITYFIPYTCSWFPGPEGRHDGWFGFWNTVRSLRKLHCKVALNTASDIRTNLLARLGGLHRLISAYARHGNWLSTTMVAPELISQHESERQLELASSLIRKKLSYYPINIQISTEDEHLANKLFKEIKNTDRPLVAIHPGANVEFKSWPLNRFAEVGNFLVKSKNCRIAVLGAPGTETKLAKELSEHIGSEAVNLAGRTPVRILLSFLKLCDLYVGNDSGIMHLSAAAGCPTVAIFGATNPYRFGPYLPGDMKCVVLSPLFSFDVIGKAREKGKEMLDAVTTGMVVSAIDEVWPRVLKKHMVTRRMV